MKDIKTGKLAATPKDQCRGLRSWCFIFRTRLGVCLPRSAEPSVWMMRRSTASCYA